MDRAGGPEGSLGSTRTRVAKPIYAAVEGHSVAGGLEMALWCDLRVAGDAAEFGCFERGFGVPLADGGPRPPRRGQVRTRSTGSELGRAVDAETAERWSSVTRLVPECQALEYAAPLAETIVGFPQETVRTDRAAVCDGVGTPLAQGLAAEGATGRAPSRGGRGCRAVRRRRGARR